MLISQHVRAMQLFLQNPFIPAYNNVITVFLSFTQLHTYIYIVKPYSQPMQRSAFTSPRQSVIPFSSPHHTSPHYSNTDHQSDQQKHGTAKPASEKETLLLRYLSREEVGWVLNTTAASAAPANNEDLSLFARFSLLSVSCCLRV